MPACIRVRDALGCTAVDTNLKDQTDRSKELDKKIKADGEVAAREVKTSFGLFSGLFKTSLAFRIPPNSGFCLEFVQNLSFLDSFF